MSDETNAEAKPTVALSCADGNAFSIIAACRKAGRRAGWSHERCDAFRKEAMAGDYDSLLQTVYKHFDVE